MATVKKVVKKAQVGVKEKMSKDSSGYTYTKEVNRPEGKRYYQGTSPDQSTSMKIASFKARNNPSDSVRTTVLKKEKAGGKVAKAKNGKQMIKRADGSYSQRGLWDNIRAAKGSGKKPTKAMLTQEKKIKAKTK